MPDSGLYISSAAPAYESNFESSPTRSVQFKHQQQQQDYSIAAQAVNSSSVDSTPSHVSLLVLQQDEPLLPCKRSP